MEQLSQTLPKNFKPVHYEIKIEDIDLHTNEFGGHVSIELEFQSGSTDQISLNIRDIEIISVNVQLKCSEIVSAESYSYDGVNDVLTLQFPRNLEEDLTLNIDYRGKIQTGTCGFYRSDYYDPISSVKKVMLSTQFEATDARTAFPCFDEPELKATFDIYIVANSKFTVLSNMPIHSHKTIDKNNQVQYKFHTGPKMSTYLVAWAIGEFDFIEALTEKSIYPTLTNYSVEDGSSSEQGKMPVRVYTAKGKAHQGKFALDVALKVIDLFSQLFEIPYPLPKLDLLAVESYARNAMENFSLITFRPSAILLDGNIETSSSMSLQKIAYVVSHEIAHQWFGNMVTMKWWDELWLNEGFATWVGYYAVAKFFPHWDVPSMVMWQSHEVALELDSLQCSHPVKVSVRNAKDIDQIFDTISYLKGCSVLEMISGYIGEEKFLKGVALYLKRNKFSNATMEDLFDCIREVSNSNILDKVKMWILNIGFPLLNVTLENGNFVLSQERCLSVHSTSDTEIGKWWIPLMFSDGKDFKNLEIDDTNNSISLSFDNFGYFNTDARGFYRVKYQDELLLSSIYKNLDKLSSRSKMGLVSDIHVTGSTKQLLELISLLSKSQDPGDFYLWTMVLNILASLKSLFFTTDDCEFVGLLDQFIFKLVEPQLDDALDFIKNPFILLNTSDPKRFLKAQFYEKIIKTAGLLQNERVYLECKTILDQKKTISFTREAILFTVLSQKSLSTETFNQIVDELKIATLAHKESLLRSLAMVQNPSLFDSVLNLMFDVESMYVQFLAESLCSNPEIRNTFWVFVKDNYDRIYTKLSVNFDMIDRFFKLGLSGFVGASLKEDVIDFFKGKNLDGFDRGIEQTIERINKNTLYVERNLAIAKEFFKL